MSYFPSNFMDLFEAIVVKQFSVLYSGILDFPSY